MAERQKISERYIVFTQDEHDTIRFDWSHKQVEEFINMWNEDEPINEIAKVMKVSKLSVALLVMDLNTCGRIQPRRIGLGVG